jgi:hypothetical protein
MLEIKKENQNYVSRVVTRYVLFYCCVITVLSFVSYILDLFFFHYDFGDKYVYRDNPLTYYLHYIIMGYFILPLSLTYNYQINKLPAGLTFKKIIFSVLFTLTIGYLLNRRYHFGYYIGEFRVLKNIIAMILSGIIIEIIRFYVVRNRYRNKS